MAVTMVGFVWCMVVFSRPLLWSSSQNSWLRIKRSGFNPQCYQIFREAVGLKRGALSLVSTTEELLERKCSGFGLDNREYGRRDPPHWPRDTLYQQKLALTSSTSGGRSASIVCSRTKATEFSFKLFSPVNKDWCMHHSCM
jgi:hypothetical protein